MATNKKQDTFKTPSIGGLLGAITENVKHQEAVPRQIVTPVKELKQENTKTVKQDALGEKPNLNTQEFNHLNSKEVKTKTGRKTAKSEDVEYVKFSPKIPVNVKFEASKAVLERRFTDKDGQVIKTLDELVSYALQKLLQLD